MTKSILIVCFIMTICSLFIQQVEPRPLHAIGKTAGKLLSILGTGTYYDVGAGLGSCGQMHHDNELVVAVNHAQMNNGGNPNKNPHCGKKVKVMGKTKKAVEATIVDTCPGCSKGSLDMSPQLFKKVCGALALGVCKIQWGFV